MGAFSAVRRVLVVVGACGTLGACATHYEQSFGGVRDNADISYYLGGANSEKTCLDPKFVSDGVEKYQNDNNNKQSPVENKTTRLPSVSTITINVSSNPNGTASLRVSTQGGAGVTVAPGGSSSVGATADGGNGSLPFTPCAKLVVKGAMDACVHFGYQRSFQSYTEAVFDTILGIGPVLAPAIAAASGASSGTTVLVAGGAAAGATFLGNAKAAIPQAPQTSPVKNIEEAAKTYYPYIKETVECKDQKCTGDELRVAYRHLWDAAGTGCNPGVLTSIYPPAAITP